MRRYYEDNGQDFCYRADGAGFRCQFTLQTVTNSTGDSDVFGKSVAIFNGMDAVGVWNLTRHEPAVSYTEDNAAQTYIEKAIYAPDMYSMIRQVIDFGNCVDIYDDPIVSGTIPSRSSLIVGSGIGSLRTATPLRCFRVLMSLNGRSYHIHSKAQSSRDMGFRSHQ